jgi:hypothetical protein
MYKAIKKNEDGEFEFWYNPQDKPKTENLMFPDVVMDEWEKHTISIPFYSDDDKNKILDECFEHCKEHNGWATLDDLLKAGIRVYNIELSELHTITKSGSFIDYQVKYKNPNDPKTLEDYLKYFETVKYESWGFGMIFLYYRYEDKKWDIAFRNAKNFDNPEIVADTPLEACKKMFEYIKSNKL